MAEKKTSKKKTTKKVVEKKDVQVEEFTSPKEIAVTMPMPNGDNGTEAMDCSEVPDDMVFEQPFVYTGKEPTLNRYRFISTVSNLNISNVVFDSMNIIVYECKATSKEDAIFEFKTKVMDNFAKGSEVNYIKFMVAVFGSRDNIILEEVNGVNNVTEEIITL